MSNRTQKLLNAATVFRNHVGPWYISDLQLAMCAVHCNRNHLQRSELYSYVDIRLVIWYFRDYHHFTSQAFSFSFKTTRIIQAGESVKLSLTGKKAVANQRSGSFFPL